MVVVCFPEFLKSVKKDTMKTHNSQNPRVSQVRQNTLIRYRNVILNISKMLLRLYRKCACAGRELGLICLDMYICSHVTYFEQGY